MTVMRQQKQKSALTNLDITSLRALRSGDAIDMQITTPTVPKRVKTGFVGMDLPNCMIFQLPSEARWGYLRDLLLPDTDLIIRYVLEGQDGKVIAFKVKVIRVINNPSSLVLTSMPQSLQQQVLRSEKRITPGISTKVSFVDKEKSMVTRGLIVDVSLKGCKVVVEIDPDFPELAVDNKVTLLINDGTDSSEIVAQVKNIRQDKNALFYGVKFDAKQDVIESLIKRFILQY